MEAVMSITMDEYERLLVKQKQEAYSMEQHQIKGSVASHTFEGEQPKLKAQIIAQQDALIGNICHLEAVIETLAQRLQPVLIDAPSACRQEELAGGMSPVAGVIYSANKRMTSALDNLQDLIERLEV
jgi:hypothetical protein